MKTKKLLIPVLALVLILAMGSIISVSANNSPANNSEQNQRIERGPGTNCDDCNGEPEQRQIREEEERELEEGENGEQTQEQNQIQKNQNS